MIDGFLLEASPFVRGIGFALDLVIAGAFAGIGYLARRYTWPFITGMIVYAADTLIFVVVQEWIGVGFHAFALIAIYGGDRAALALAERPPVLAPVPAPQAPAAS